MWSALSGHRPTSCAKLPFVIASCMMDKVASIGQIANFTDPGLNATPCTAPMIEKLKNEVELHNPSVIFTHVPWTDDEKTSPGYGKLTEFIAE